MTLKSRLAIVIALAAVSLSIWTAGSLLEPRPVAITLHKQQLGLRPKKLYDRTIVGKVTIGMTGREVEAILGPPYYDSPSLEYVNCLATWRDDADMCISVTFDEDGRCSRVPFFGYQIP